MAKKTLDIIDESGDKKYFTIIPNYILNHSSANDQALYLQMKRLANDNETCYASDKYFMDKLSIGRKAIKKSIQYLLNHKWIKFDGFREANTKGGKQNVKTYKIVDLWKLNIKHYQKGVSERIPLTKNKGVLERAQGGVQKSTKGCLKEHQRRTVTKNNKNVLQTKVCDNKINILLKEFESVNPTINYGNKTQRKTLQELLDKFGYEKLLSIIKFAVSVQGKTYTPTITTPIQLKNKLGDLIVYYKKENNNKPIIQSL